MKATGAITFILLVSLVIYCCVIVGRRADEWEENYWEERK